MEDYQRFRNSWNSFSPEHSKNTVKREGKIGNEHGKSGGGSMLVKYAGEGRCSSLRTHGDACAYYEHDVHDQEGMLVIRDFCSACFWCFEMNVSTT